MQSQGHERFMIEFETLRYQLSNTSEENPRLDITTGALNVSLIEVKGRILVEEDWSPS